MNKFQTLEEAQEAWEKILVLIIPAAVDIAVLDGGKPLRERMHDFIVSVWHSAYQAGVEKCVEAVPKEKAMHWTYCKYHNGTTAPDILMACDVVQNGCRYLITPAEAEAWNSCRAAILEKLEALRK